MIITRRLANFLAHRFTLRISLNVKHLILVLLFILLITYLCWEIYWCAAVGIRFIKWHTHFASYVLLYVIVCTTLYVSGKNIWLNLLYTLIALVVLEALCMLVTPSDREFIDFFTVNEKNYYHVWTSDTCIEILTTEFKHERCYNSLGFPDKEPSTPKHDSVIRIISLGDSFTEGFGAPYDSSYPSLLKKVAGI